MHLWEKDKEKIGLFYRELSSTKEIRHRKSGENGILFIDITNKLEFLEEVMHLEELRNDIIMKQKKGLPFILASIVLWLLITMVATLHIQIGLKNILVFCCSTPLLPFSWWIGKKIGVDIFSKENALGNLGFLFTMNQILYLLIVMWVFNAVPEKMIMVYAMVFGAHLLPYSWLYKSKAYIFFAIMIPILSLILGSFFNSAVVAGTLVIVEIVFALTLQNEVKIFEKQASSNGSN